MKKIHIDIRDMLANLMPPIAVVIPLIAKPPTPVIKMKDPAA